MRLSLNSLAGGIYTVHYANEVDFRLQDLPEVGTKVSYEDGRSYRFVASEANFAAGASVEQTPYISGTIYSAATFGVDSLFIVAAGIAEGELTDGYIEITQAGKLPGKFQIRGNTSSTSSNVVKVSLNESIPEDYAATNTILIHKAVGYRVVASGSGNGVIGTTLCAVSAATNSTTAYFWVQMSGVNVGVGGGLAGYTITAPTTGYDREFNPNTCSIGEIAIVLATLLKDLTE